MEKKEKKTKLRICDGCILAGVVTLLAFLVHPSLTQAMEEKKLVDMVDCLHQIRSGIRLYKAENGLFPGQEKIGDLSVTSDEFIAALKDFHTDGPEPYLIEFPANPYVLDVEAASTITCVSDRNAQPAGTEQTGWWFNAATGRFYACDSEFHTNY